MNLDTLTFYGIVLKEVLYNDNDKILTVLTANKGIISVTAKGVKSIKSKNSSAVQLFCYSEFEILKYKSQYVLKSANLKDGFYGIRDDVEKYALACYFAEITAFFATSENDETDVLRLLLNALYVVAKDENKPLWLTKAAFELKLACVCGFAPQFEYCKSCGTALGAIHSKHVFFSFAENEIICEDCVSKNGNNYGENLKKLSVSASFAIQYVINSQINRFASFSLDGINASAFCEFCEKYLIYTAERSFESLKFYYSIEKQLLKDQK